MPRYTADESAVVLAMSEAFVADTKDDRIRGLLKSIIRKTTQSHEHHTRKAASKGHGHEPRRQ